MKAKYIFTITTIVVLGIGKIGSQPLPANLSLSGTQTGNREYKALSSIESTQTINSGATKYTAGNKIVLKPGFRAKAGSEFRAAIDGILTIMTCNVQYRRYSRHAQVILESGADVVAVQEIRGRRKFNVLREETGFKGYMGVALDVYLYKQGIALLWNEEKVGSPVSIKTERILTIFDDGDWTRVYIVAEFENFIIIATHLSTDTDANKRQVENILNEDVVKNYRKPVFIAGDLNPRPKGEIPRSSDNYETISALKAVGFEVLNYREETTDPNSDYRKYHATNSGGGQPDKILWLNQNPNRGIIDRGVPECLWAEDKPNGYLGGKYQAWRFEISDHLPYVVKVKLK